MLIRVYQKELLQIQINPEIAPFDHLIFFINLQTGG